MRSSPLVDEAAESVRPHSCPQHSLIVTKDRRLFLIPYIFIEPLVIVAITVSCPQRGWLLDIGRLSVWLQICSFFPQNENDTS